MNKWIYYCRGSLGFGILGSRLDVLFACLFHHGSCIHTVWFGVLDLFWGPVGGYLYRFAMDKDFIRFTLLQLW